MKKTILVVLAFVIGLLDMNAQVDTKTIHFGAKAGYSSFIIRVSAEGSSASDDLNGFYFGVFADLEVSEKFSVQPEIMYGNFSEDGESTGVLIVPVLAKFKPDPKLGIFAGPQFDYLLEEEDAEGLKRLGFGVVFGASYDITEQLIVDARYSLGISDRLDAPIPGFENIDFNTTFRFFQIGLGYRF